jgi:hypothetical protein
MGFFVFKLVFLNNAECGGNINQLNENGRKL